jgi:hypothetical protein
VVPSQAAAGGANSCSGVLAAGCGMQRDNTRAQASAFVVNMSSAHFFFPRCILFFLDTKLQLQQRK